MITISLSNASRYFLKNGYHVIFLYRSKSLEPFIRQVDVGELLKEISFQDNPHSTGWRTLEPLS